MRNNNLRQAVEAQQNFSNTLRLDNRPKGGVKIIVIQFGIF